MATRVRVIAHAHPNHHHPMISQLRAKRRALLTLHVRYIRDAMSATDTDARRAAFESAHDIDHAVRAIDDRLARIRPDPPKPLDLHARIYDV